MTLVNKKDNTSKITINAKYNKVFVTKGFVHITKGTHFGHSTIRPDLLEHYYELPKNIIFIG